MYSAQFIGTASLVTLSTGQTFNQSIKIYIAPLQDPYSEALPTQAKRKRTITQLVIKPASIKDVMAREFQQFLKSGQISYRYNRIY